MTTTELQDRVETALGEHVIPALSAHGGSIRIVDIESHRIALEFRGACDFCYFRRACAVNLVRPVIEQHVDPDLTVVISGI